MPVARRSSMALSACAASSSAKRSPTIGLHEALLREAVDLGADLSVELGLAQHVSAPAGAHDLDVVEQQAVDPHLGDRAAGEADDDRTPALAQRAQAVGEAIAADRVEDHVDAAARELLRLVLPRAIASARPRRRPASRATRSFSSLDTTAIVLAPSPLATCSDAVPTPPAAPWTSTVSPSASRPRELQREVRGVVVEDQPRALREVERVGQREGEARRRHGHLGEAAEHAERGDAVARREPRAPSGALRTIPATSLPGTNGSGGLSWYSPRVCRTSGNDDAGGVHVDETPSPGVSGCEASGSATSTSSSADSGPDRSVI